MPSNPLIEDEVEVQLNDAGAHSTSSVADIKKTKALISTLITGIGNLAVQCNFQAVSIALIVMSMSQCTLANEAECKEGEQATWVSSTLHAIVFAGSILGQLTMGYAGDVMGIDAAMGFTLSLAMLGAFFSAVLPQGSPNTVYGVLAACRFLLGMGLGGVYPLSAIKAAQDASRGGKSNNRSAARAFFWQAPGSMMPWILALIIAQTSMSTESKWRLLLGFGAIPLAIAVGLSQIESRIGPKRAPAVKVVKPSMLTVLSNPDLVWKLVGTGGSWFIFDVCYYGVALFGGEILSAVNEGSSEDDDVTSRQHITLISWQQSIALGAAIPAYLLTNYLVKKQGMKKIQIIGFIFTAVLFFIMAGVFYPLKKSSPEALYFIFVILLFSLCFGPNVTTYVLPAAVYDKDVRSTMNGLSAALGKLGAVVGAYVFGAIATETGYPTVMVACGVLSLFGAFVSHRYIADGLDAPQEESVHSDAHNPLLADEKH